MKKKVVNVLLTMVLATGLLVGCGNSGDDLPKTQTDTAEQKDDSEAEDTATPASSDEKIKIGYVCKDLSQTWFIQVTDNLKAYAEANGAEVILADTAMDPEKYLTAVDNMIAQQVDVLIVCPPDQKLSQSTVERCNEAGIKVFADADGLIDEEGKHIAPALELDAYVVGISQGEWIGNYALENNLAADDGAMYLCMTIETVSSCVPRSEGALDKFKELVPDFPEDKIIKADYDGSSELAYDVVAATVTANPQITKWIVTAPNEEGAQGATRALEAAGVDSDSCVTGLGGYLAKDEFKKDFSCFKASGYFMASEDGQVIGKAAVNWAKDDSAVPFMEYLKEGEEFGVYPLGATMVTVENYEEIMGEDAK